MGGRGFKQLTARDRVLISKLREKKLSLSEIARQIGKNKSTVSRELRRNQSRVTPLAEADDKRALSRGMQGLCIRIAKALNRVLGRAGGIFADHYHSRLLRSPSELCAGLRYVLGNAEHHFGDRGADWFSSASAEGATARAEPRGWLLRIGWQRGRWPRGGSPPGLRYRVRGGTAIAPDLPQR